MDFAIKRSQAIRKSTGFAFKLGLILEEDSTVAEFFGKEEFTSSPQRGRTALGPGLATRRSSHHAYPAASTHQQPRHPPAILHQPSAALALQEPATG